MSENVKVMIRCRPFNAAENSKNNIVQIDNEARRLNVTRPKAAHEPPRIFTFDHIFGVSSTQTEVYEQSTFMLV